MERVLIDTNVMVVGAKDYAEEKNTPESQILKLALDKEIKVVINPLLLKEYHRVAEDLAGKDFAGWFRNVIMKDLSVAYTGETETRNLMEKYKGEIPPEDLPHFASCLLSDADHLISENRSFLKRARGFGFKCSTPEEYLESRRNCSSPE